jgi:cytochrome c oxidase assembly protein subunit 15
MTAPSSDKSSSGFVDYAAIRTPSAPYNRGLHLMALLTAAATFPLVFMGGLVTSHEAGLAVPDWPNSFGYNMITFPPSQWIGGIFYEHVHRLLGTLVGVLAIALLVHALIVERRAWVKWLSGAFLIAVSVQGVLGGLRVIWVHLDLAIVHGCLGQAVFCLIALIATVTSRRWIEPSAAPSSAAGAPAGRVLRLAAIAVALIYAQLIVGAVMRHYRAGLAIPDFPLSYGRLLPPTNAAELARINQWRIQQPEQVDLNTDARGVVGAVNRYRDGQRQFTLDPVSMWQVWLHFAHRVGAIVVSVGVITLVVHILRRHRDEPWLTRLAWLSAALLIAQLALGVLTVLWRKPPDIASAHVAVGALLLAAAFVIAARAVRLGGQQGSSAALAPRRPAGSAEALPRPQAVAGRAC